MSEHKQSFHVGDTGSNPVGDAELLSEVISETSECAGKDTSESSKAPLTPISPQVSQETGEPVPARKRGRPRKLVAIEPEPTPPSPREWVWKDTLRGLFTSERRALKEARSRCFTPTNKDFADYGGRGIVVCKRWLGLRGFESFLADVGPKPSSFHTLERIDADGNYAPGNVRWADRREQANNRRTSRMVEWDGEVMTAAELGRLVGLSRQTIVKMANQGWWRRPEVS